MIALIQRVNHASVKVDGEIIGAIDAGLLAFVAIEKHDTPQTVEKMVEKIIHYRIFSDDAGKMNRSLQDTAGGLLLVSQFTLLANTDKGRRPSFTDSPSVEMSIALYEHSIMHAKTLLQTVAQGEFGADMKVSLENDGPVTFWLEV